MNERIIILDFGSQYTQLIARRLRELHIYCEIFPYHHPIELDPNCKAVILSGSPFSALDDHAPAPDMTSWLGKVPVLGICYGAQYLAHAFGGEVVKSDKREYGKASVRHLADPSFFADIEAPAQVWMSHGDTIEKLPDVFEVIAQTESIPVAAFRSANGRFEQAVYGIQFHPEVTHTLIGKDVLRNFAVGIAGCACDWTPESFVDMTVARLRAQLADDHVLLGLSGGVDSTVAAGLLHRAIGQRLHCFFIDNGLLRKDEFDQVLTSYDGMGLNIRGIRRSQRFLSELAEITDPEEKRKIIGRVFIEVFEEEANKLAGIEWLAQGTIYPDVIESISVHGPSATIKSHHNVGGLPERLNLRIVEPLRMLFKDEVRRVGATLDIPEHILLRHPFPGPGLAIRIMGAVTAEKVRLCQEADAIYIDLMKRYGLYERVWQAGAILLPVQSVGVMGDERTYEFTIALRCVNSVDGMTAEWSRLPHDFLADASSQIINQVKGINRVVYDISTKPPATIEWE